MADLSLLTASLPHLAGVYKARWEDFVVEEIPARSPQGEGEHVWMEVEKHGLTTARAAADLARALGVRPASVGYAGMKDARAITRQWMSVEHVTPQQALALDIPRVRVLRAERHPRKLRRGWHAGNRFVIRLRGSSLATPAALDVARALLDFLSARGVPNYYGPQRFGYRGDTWRVGRALARGEWGRAAALVAGRPLRPDDPAVDHAGGVFPDVDDILRARELYDAGRYREAADAWPRGFAQCARLAAAMDRTGGDAERALPVLGKRMLRLYASAYQAWLFNRVLTARVQRLDRLLPGDLAWKHDTEALFLVDDPAAEQSRADAFEISPTGPLVGRRMRPPAGDAAALEARVLEESDLRPEELTSRAMAALSGARRPLRFPVLEPALRSGQDDFGSYLELRFALPPGCYATAVLREIGGGAIRERAAEPAGGGQGAPASDGGTAAADRGRTPTPPVMRTP